MKRSYVLKTIFALLVGLSFSGAANAQLFAKGDKVINLGIGVPVFLNGSGYETRLPLVSGSFDYGILDDLIDGKASIGVGGYLGHTANRFKYVGNYEYDFSYLLIGPRASFHYHLIDELDTYGGLMFGYNIVSSSGNGQFKPNNHSRFMSALYIGARYYFAGNISAFAEIGYGISLIEVGLSFKF
jgi:hypothetical protein